MDIPDGTYHVIGRGVERRPIFRHDHDCADFLERLVRIADEENLTVHAYVLMGNHFHAVLQRAGTPLGHCMHRLLTGYTRVFNQRYGRTGHLFQNRYRAILCETDPYLLQLVRYVHLNPVRACLVTDPSQYRWSSHRDYLSCTPPPWLHTETVMSALGGRAAYRRFVQDGLTEGTREDLNGRHVPGGTERRVWAGGQVLGSETYARRAAREARFQQLERAGDPVEELSQLAQSIVEKAKLRPSDLIGASRKRRISAARRTLIWKAVVERGIRPIELSRYLGIRAASVSGHLRAAEKLKN